MTTRSQMLSTLSCDKLIHRKDGSWVAKWGFFYTHGRTSEKYAEEGKAAYPQATIIDAVQNWQTWPRDSYFEVKFRLGD